MSSNDLLATLDIQRISSSRLRLDPENPRLLKFAEDETMTDEVMVDAILSRFDPEPVGRSIVEFGFFMTEPLVVFPDGDNYIVAEGNRRLAALKLLTDPELRKAVDAGKEWDRLAARLEADPEALARLQEIPSQVVPTRADAAPLIGYRHIVGILKWDAFEKAAYVVSLLRQVDDRTFEEVADLVGEKPGRVKRYFRDWLALEQAEDHDLDTQAAKEEFGRWERAMNAKGVREYIGAKSPSDLDETSTEAYSSQPEQMARMLSFLYGEAGGPDRVLADTRRIDDLSVALQSEEGREILENQRDLDAAFEVAGGRLSYVVRGLTKALAGLQQAADDFADHADVDEVKRLMDAILDQMASMESEAKEFDDSDDVDDADQLALQDDEEIEPIDVDEFDEDDDE